MTTRTSRTPRVIAVSAILVVTLLPIADAGATDHPFPGLEPGSYPVGFRVIDLVDRGRTLRAPVDFRGEPVPGEHRRALLTAFWYPSVPETDASTMPYRNYVEIKVAEGRGPLTDSLRTAGVDAHRAELLRDGGEEALIARLLDLPTWAFPDAPPAAGRFPLVLVAQGGYSDSFSNSYLCEYIASYGFAVASFPTKGMSSTQIETDLRGVEAQARDLEFLLGELCDHPHVDASRPALVGRSWGGLTAIIVALRNHDIRIVVSLDGTIITPWAYDEMSRLYPYFDGHRLRAAFLNVFASASAAEGFSETFVEEAKYADRYQIRFPKMRHESFASDDLLSAFRTGPGVEISVPLEDETIEDLVTGFEAACRYTLWGIRGYVEEDPESLARLKQAPTGNDVLTVSHLAALPAPPSEQEFIDILTGEGVETARALYDTVRLHDPHYRIFSQRAMALLGYQAINDGRYAFARGVFDMFAQSYAESGNAWHGLGEAHMYLHERERAAACFKRSIELIPENALAKQYLEELETSTP